MLFTCPDFFHTKNICFLEKRIFRDIAIYLPWFFPHKEYFLGKFAFYKKEYWENIIIRKCLNLKVHLSESYFCYGVLSGYNIIKSKKWWCRMIVIKKPTICGISFLLGVFLLISMRKSWEIVMFTCLTDWVSFRHHFVSFTIRIRIRINLRRARSMKKLRDCDVYLWLSFFFFYNQNQNLNSWKKWREKKSDKWWKSWEIVMFTCLTDWLSYQRKTLHHQTLSGPTSHNLSWKYQILILTMKNTTTNKCFLLNREPTSNCSVSFQRLNVYMYGATSQC